MSLIHDGLQWVRKTSSSFAGLLAEDTPQHGATGSLPPAPPPGELIYRLRQWPTLPPACRTADVYRALSLMSTRPVNRRWFVASTHLGQVDADRLLQTLCDEGALEIIDPGRFATGSR